MADKKATSGDILKLIKDKEVKYVDIRFTDPRGKWQHVTFDLMMVDEEFLNHGTMFGRLLHRRLEGDQRVRHAPEAGPRTPR
jgi:glutamine synthetase